MKKLLYRPDIRQKESHIQTTLGTTKNDPTEVEKSSKTCVRGAMPGPILKINGMTQLAHLKYR